MQKIDYTFFLELYADFWNTVKKSVIVIFIPLSFVYLIALQVLTFAEQIIKLLFGHFDTEDNDNPTGVRIAKVIVFGYVHIVKGFALGVLETCVFVIGFFYDLTNKIMTLGKSETSFVELRKSFCA